MLKGFTSPALKNVHYELFLVERVSDGWDEMEAVLCFAENSLLHHSRA